MPKLYIVATPIGNLKDITLRAIETLKSVEVILAEDTRVTRKLLAHYGIKKQILRLRENIQPDRLGKFEKIALVTDAGTPGISDPGQRLIAEISKFRNTYLSGRLVDIIPIPGPSALSAIISASDIDLSKFCFFGFPPHKKGRQTFFRQMAKLDMPVILFESPHRIQKTLRWLLEVCGDRRVNIGRELTKIYEEIFRGKLSEAEKYFIGEKQRGEFVIITDIQ